MFISNQGPGGGAAFTTTAIGTVWVRGPLCPVTVMVAAPRAASAAAVRVRTVPAASAAGTKVAVTPAGRPVALNDTTCEKPLVGRTAIETLVELPSTKAGPAR